MKIGILTQPLYCNYGGILQCYALQTTLQRMGYETIILQREFNRKYTFFGACIYYIKHFIKLLLGRKSSWHYFVDSHRRDYIAQNTSIFIERNINPRTKHCYSTKELKKEVEKLNLGAIIVGSDQVWRPDYSPCLPNYFLDFIKDNSCIKKISYAASFGKDQWALSRKKTAKYRELLQTFDAISVRESSAIKLCKDLFRVDATQVIDPTLLLESKDYLSLVTTKKTNRGNLFCYILDKSIKKKNIIDFLSHKNNYKPFESMPLLSDTKDNLFKDIDKCVYPPIEDWLLAFMEAEMVLTDSFHGTVFSIIFNKPFWVIGNPERGIARFESLLSLFDLSCRIISDSDFMNLDFMKPIDWETVNKRKMFLQKDSLQFISNSLN